MVILVLVLTRFVCSITPTKGKEVSLIFIQYSELNDFFKNKIRQILAKYSVAANFFCSDLVNIFLPILSISLFGIVNIIFLLK